MQSSVGLDWTLAFSYCVLQLHCYKVLQLYQQSDSDMNTHIHTVLLCLASSDKLSVTSDLRGIIFLIHFILLCAYSLHNQQIIDACNHWIIVFGNWFLLAIKICRAAVSCKTLESQDLLMDLTWLHVYITVQMLQPVLWPVAEVLYWWHFKYSVLFVIHTLKHF